MGYTIGLSGRRPVLMDAASSQRIGGRKKVDGDSMKIAYLVLAHTHPLHLTRLIAALETEQAHIFLHIDKKSHDMICPPLVNNITLIKKTVAVNCGSLALFKRRGYYGN